MSDTPRTDAAAMEGDTTVVVDTDFARQLERESDALRRELEQAKTSLQSVFCPWCQTSYAKGTDAHKAVLLHLETCLKHPISERDRLKDQLAAAQKEIAELKRHREQLIAALIVEYTAPLQDGVPEFACTDCGQSASRKEAIEHDANCSVAIAQAKGEKA